MFAVDLLLAAIDDVLDPLCVVPTSLAAEPDELEDIQFQGVSVGGHRFEAGAIYVHGLP